METFRWQTNKKVDTCQINATIIHNYFIQSLPTTKSEYKEYLDNNKIFGNFSAAPYSAALNNTILKS